MWLGLRYLAVGMPADTAILSELGVGDDVKDTAMVLRYKRLSRDFPNIKLGPDESIYDHFKRLENAKRGIQDRGPQSVPAFTLNNPDPDVASWITGTKGAPPVGQQQSGLPARDPGWWTSPWSESRGYGAPPMDQRTPGATMRSPNGPSYAPDPQSMQNWVQWLRDKGISVNHALEVPNAARSLPNRPHGRDLVQEFTGPTTDDSMSTAVRGLPEDMGGMGRSWRQRAKDFLGRRKASTTVVDYIEGTLVAVASLEDSMHTAGWGYHRSGSGNWYQKTIGDKVHILEEQPDGSWIHNSGPTEDDMSDNPIGFMSLERAMLHAHHGLTGVDYRPKPPSTVQRMN